MQYILFALLPLAAAAPIVPVTGSQAFGSVHDPLSISDKPDVLPLDVVSPSCDFGRLNDAERILCEEGLRIGKEGDFAGVSSSTYKYGPGFSDEDGTKETGFDKRFIPAAYNDDIPANDGIPEGLLGDVHDHGVYNTNVDGLTKAGEYDENHEGIVGTALDTIFGDNNDRVGSSVVKRTA